MDTSVRQSKSGTSISVRSLSRGAVRSEEEERNICCILYSGERQPGCGSTFLLIVSVLFKRVSSYVFTHGAIVVSVLFKRVSCYVFTHGAIVMSVFKRVCWLC